VERISDTLLLGDHAVIEQLDAIRLSFQRNLQHRRRDFQWQG